MHDVRDCESVASQVFGGKAAGLALLHSLGHLIPRTILIEACSDKALIDNREFQGELQSKLEGWDLVGSYNLAIRSSCTIEDGFVDSKAGHFDTFIGEMVFEDVIQNIQNVILGLEREKNSSAKMGVIVQQKVEPDYSGVLFSSDPFTYSKKTMLVSYTEGIGLGLVSGEVSGEDIVVLLKDNQFIIPEINDPINKDLLLSLIETSKTLETKLNYPVDIEWAIAGNELYFLQCRPLASITKIPNSLHLVNEENLSTLPSALVSHDKVKMRLNAQKRGIMVTDAYVSIQNNCFTENKLQSDPLIPQERTEYCNGYSAVIIYPSHISDRIVRSFIGEKVKICKDVTRCCRYGVRTFPKHENLVNCLLEYSNLVAHEYWIGVTIIQEIIDPKYTGAIRRVPDGFLVEIIRGHFFSKGVVPSSQYYANPKGHILSKEEAHQRSWYSIIEGHVLYCICNNDEDGLVSLSEKELVQVIDCFRPLLDSDKCIVEFGVFQADAHSIMPYLIDFFDDDSSANDMSATDVSEGIMSRGKVKGRIVHIYRQDEDSLHTHFHSMLTEGQKSDESIVFFCETPAIALLSLLEEFETKNIGFVFQKGSFLSHFAAVLREKGIPAIKVDTLSVEFKEGYCTIDAVTQGKLAKDRVIKTHSVFDGND
jgi:hypothetical protein